MIIKMVLQFFLIFIYMGVINTTQKRLKVLNGVLHKQERTFL